MTLRCQDGRRRGQVGQVRLRRLVAFPLHGQPPGQGVGQTEPVAPIENQLARFARLGRFGREGRALHFEFLRLLAAALHGGFGEGTADRSDKTNAAPLQRPKRPVLHGLGLVGIPQIIRQVNGGGKLLQRRPVAGPDGHLRQRVAHLHLQNARLHLSGYLQAHPARLRGGFHFRLPPEPCKNRDGFQNER